jgi:hypothetical protein
MKQLTALFLILILAISVGLTSAQDEMDSAENADSDIFSLLLQESISGTMSENEDGTYTLVAEVGELGDVIIIQPALRGIEIVNLPNLLSDWGTVEGLSATATLNHSEGIVDMQLSAPSYDVENGEITFSAEVTSVFDVQGLTEKAEVPMSFEDATLVTELSGEFNLALLEAENDNIRFAGCEAETETYYGLVANYNVAVERGAASGTLFRWASVTERLLVANGCSFEDRFDG